MLDREIIILMFYDLGNLNIDFFLVGLSMASTLILGVVVLFNNPKSITNQSFLFLSIVAIAWNIFNFSVLQFTDPYYSLPVLRLSMFFAVFYAFSIYHLMYIFPRVSYELPWKYKYYFVPAILAVAILSLTPAVFSGVAEVASDGTIARTQNGPGIIIFGLTVLGLLIRTFFVLFRKIRDTDGIERKQFIFISAGLIVTFALHVVFSFIFPAFLDVTRFVTFGAIFTFPFILFTAYAIIKHNLLNIKVISTEILALVLAIISFFEVIVAKDAAVLALRSIIFILILAFSVLLIRSVLREVKQREELERLTKQLQAANKKLEELSAYKTQLLSLASHQTKSPLSAIKSYASLVLQGLFGDVNEKVKDKLHKIVLAADELLALIDTFLNLRKVEEGRMDYKLEKSDLVELIKSKADELQPLAQGKNLEYEIKLPDHPVMINADGQKLSQVIQNFIDNAIKYTPEGKVTVSLVDEGGGEVIFSVHDSGYGIPADLLTHLFEEYVRDERIKNKVRGTGFGLFIAKKIVEAHGGTVWAESEGENKGSTFLMKVKKLGGEAPAPTATTPSTG